MKTIATGSNPFLRKDKATGLMFYLYWTSASSGTLWLKRSEDDGTTFKDASPIAVAAGVAQQTATLDWMLDARHTLVVVYQSGSDIVQVESTDNGLTFA